VVPFPIATAGCPRLSLPRLRGRSRPPPSILRKDQECGTLLLHRVSVPLSPRLEPVCVPVLDPGVRQPPGRRFLGLDRVEAGRSFVSETPGACDLDPSGSKTSSKPPERPKAPKEPCPTELASPSRPLDGWSFFQAHDSTVGPAEFLNGETRARARKLACRSSRVCPLEFRWAERRWCRSPRGFGGVRPTRRSIQ